jgi:hypothetical protein
MFSHLFKSMFNVSRKNHKREGRRRALTSPDSGYRYWLDENGDRVRRLQQMEPAYPDTTGIAAQLTENGFVVGTTDQLLEEEGRKAFVEAAKLVFDVSRSGNVQSIVNAGRSHDKKDYIVHLLSADQRHGADSALLRLALDKKLLEIVSLYLGMWPRLHAIGAWLNFPTPDQAKTSQLWHRDPEDLRLIKAFIYLVDVDADHGPFCYIPKTQPFGARAAINPTSGNPKHIADEEMQAAIPAQDWLACTGPAGTMILADTVGFHRGGKPTVGHRIVISFTYTSGTALKHRVFKPDGAPDWASHDIQRYALYHGATNIEAGGSA